MSSYTGSLSDIQTVTVLPFLATASDVTGGSQGIPSITTIPGPPPLPASVPILSTERGGVIGSPEYGPPANLAYKAPTGIPYSPQVQKWLVVIIVSVLLLTAIGLIRKKG